MPDEEELEEEETQEETAAATVATLEPVARWRVHAASDGPQGADGTEELARSAWRNLLAAEWEADESAAAMPVHEYDREEPRGQAYKAVWGYDAEARAQRSSAGAACYTYRLPDDALDAGNADGVARVVAVRANVAADRYCAAGAYLVALCSDSPAPPSLALFAARAQADGAEAWLATDGQTDASGAPLPPNRRSGGSAFAAAEPAGGLPPGPFLHLCLMLADYLGVRGNWIEGGAMFASETAEAEFSRAVEPGNAGVPPAALLPLGLGRMDYSATTPAAAIVQLPRVSCWANWTMAVQPLLGKLADNSWSAAAANLLAFVLNGRGLYAGQAENGILSGGTAALGATGVAGLTVAGSGDALSGTVAFCCLCAHGATGRRVFRGISFGTPLDASSVPVRVAVYGMSEASLLLGSAPCVSTPVVWWGDVIPEAFRMGAARAVRVMKAPQQLGTGDYASLTSAANSPGGSADSFAEAAVEPLASVRASGEVASIPFRRPWASGEISTVLVAVVPDGAPAGAGGSETIACTVRRRLVAALSNSGASAVTRTERDVNATSCTVRMRVETPQDSMSYVVPPGTGVSLERVSTGVVDYPSFPSYHVDRLVTASGTTVDVSFSGVSVTCVHDGVTYTAQIPDFTRSGKLTVTPRGIGFGGTAQPAAQPAGTLASIRPDTLPGFWTGYADVTVATEAFTRTVVCRSPSGAERTFTVTFPARTLAHQEQRSSASFSSGTFKARASGASSASAYTPGNSLWTALAAYESDWPFYDTAAAMSYDTYSASGSLVAASAKLRYSYAYAWASQASGSLAVAARYLIEASFSRTEGGTARTYSASWTEEIGSMSLALANKTGATTAHSKDYTATCTASGTLPAVDKVVEFAGPAGRRLPARFAMAGGNFNSAISDWGPKLLLAKAAYLADDQTLLERTAQSATVAVSTGGATATIDLGLVCLYE